MTWIVGAYADYLKYWFPSPYKFYIGTPPRRHPRVLSAARRQSRAARGGFRPGHLQSVAELGRLQVGGRYTHATTKNHGNVLQFGTSIDITQSAHYSNFSGKVSLNWTADPHNFLYGFVSTGFRPGRPERPRGLGPSRALQARENHRLRSSAGRTSASTAICARNSMRSTTTTTTSRSSSAIRLFPTFGFELNNPNTTNIYGVEAQTQASFGASLVRCGHRVDAQLTRPLLRDRSAHRELHALRSGRRAQPARLASILRGTTKPMRRTSPSMSARSTIFTLGDGDTLTPRVNFGHVSEQWATLFENPALGDRIGARNILNAQLAWTHGAIVTTLYATNADRSAIRRRAQFGTPLRRAAAPIRHPRDESILIRLRSCGRRAGTTAGGRSFSPASRCSCNPTL